MTITLIIHCYRMHTDNNCRLHKPAAPGEGGGVRRVGGGGGVWKVKCVRKTASLMLCLKLETPCHHAGHPVT